MEMRPGHAPSGADEADLLSSLDSFAFRYVRPTQMKVSGHYSATVIDVHDIAGEEESVHKRDYAAVCRDHRRADSTAEVDAEVPARHDAAEGTTGAEAARDNGRPRPQKRCRPHVRSRVRPASYFARSLVFAIDTRPHLGVERPGESGVDVEPPRPAAPSSGS